MLITVKRIKSDDDTTIATLSVDVCFGLKDGFRENEGVDSDC